MRRGAPRLETATHPSTVTTVVRPAPHYRWRWPVAAALAVAVRAADCMARGPCGAAGENGDIAASAGGCARPSVAVLHFGNATGDQSLDCMRTGIADMVVTDLSQSPQVEVLSTEHLSSCRCCSKWTLQSGG